MVCMYTVQIGRGGKGNIILSKHLSPFIAEGRQIGAVHQFHKGINLCLDGFISRDSGRNRNKGIICHFPASVFLPAHGEGTEIFAILSAGNDIGISVADRSLQCRVGMTADNQIDIRDIFCQNFIL